MGKRAESEQPACADGRVWGYSVIGKAVPGGQLQGLDVGVEKPQGFGDHLHARGIAGDEDQRETLPVVFRQNAGKRIAFGPVGHTGKGNVGLVFQQAFKHVRLPRIGRFSSAECRLRSRLHNSR